MILDKSGSMQSLRDETIVNFNNFVKEQKAVPGEARLTVVLFNTIWGKLLDGKNLKDISDNFLDRDNYFPDGYTALFDAVASTIDGVGKRLADTPENDRPANVLFVIVTDGEENSSREFKKEDVLKRIKTQEKDYNWKFLYLGCSAEQMDAGKAIGVNSKFMMQYAPSPAGVSAMYCSVSSLARSMRGGAVDLTLGDPQPAMAAGNPADIKQASIQ